MVLADPSHPLSIGVKLLYLEGVGEDGTGGVNGCPPKNNPSNQIHVAK
jgi:hypothetical protein